MKRNLEEMVKQGIIEPSTSDWSAPMLIVIQKDGRIRICVDYRCLNSVSKADAYPIPRIEDLIDQLGNAKYLSMLDFTRGYWQIPVVAEHCHKTAFATPWGLYQFRRMPFGLRGGPATFQRMMDALLRGVENVSNAYIDDIIVFSLTWEEHLRHLTEVLQWLREARLTVRQRKCQFGMTECTYLGFRVGGGRVHVEQSKVEAVQRLPIPRTKKDVRAFLGLTGYYRKFIPQYASIATPLTDLTRKLAPARVVWTHECEQSFQKLKQLLCSAPVLNTPDFERNFVLQTDASDRGVGAVLSQLSENGEDHPIAYFSRKLSSREERFSTIEKECLGIKLAAQAFRVYLLGRPFIIQTDHRALTWLDRVKDNNPRLTRWSLSLQPFQYTVVHRAGQANGNADGLSRIVDDGIVPGEGGRSVED